MTISLTRRPSAAGYSLIQLVVTLVIAAVLCLFLLAALSRASRNARQAQSISNLRQIGTAVLAYAADHQGFIPAHTQSGKKSNTLGINIGSGAAPRKLFSRDNPLGQGEVAYLATPDVMYSPFVEGMADRKPGQFFIASTGGGRIGYIFYYWSRAADNATTLPDLYNERTLENPRAPIYSEMMAELALANGFTSDRCAVLYLDGSVRSFEQKQVDLPGWKARMRVMADLP